MKVDLYRTVYVVGHQDECIKMFCERGWWAVEHIEDADLVQFCGGSDVSPAMYGEGVHYTTRTNPARDVYERKVYEYALSLQKPMAGICRGGQFLHVMNGGSLWQDVNNHTSTHLAKVCKGSKGLTRQQGDNLVKATKSEGGEMEVTSTHHQMMKMPEKLGVTLLTASLSTYKHGADPIKDRCVYSYVDIESVWYPETKSLCYQPHPEYTEVGHPCQTFYFSALENLIFNKEKKQ